MTERLLTSLAALGIALAPALIKFADTGSAPVEMDAEAEVLCVGAEKAAVHAGFRSSKVDARIAPGTVVQVLDEKSNWYRVAYVAKGAAAIGWLPSNLLETCAERIAAPASDTAEPTASPSGRATQAPLTIFSVDIGQGDSTVILGPTVNGKRKSLVMDCGDRAPSGGRIVRELLQEQGVKSLDYVVLSHFDADHLAGFVASSGNTSPLLWSSEECDPTSFFPKLAIYDQGNDENQTQASRQWTRCVPQIANQRGTKHFRVQGGQEIGTVLDLGGDAKATIVAGDGFVLNRAERVEKVNTANERSIALLVSNGAGFDFLVTGDLIGQAAGAEDAPAESALGAALRTAGVDIEVLRTGHHGAANATESKFLSSIRAEVAIISTGNNQKSNFRHPRCKTYESLQKAGVGLVLQTELGKTDCPDDLPLDPVVVNGTIKLEVEGGQYTIASYGVESPTNGEPTNEVAFTCSLSNGCSTGSAPPSGPAGGGCCKTCTNSKPCGNSCVPTTATCNQPPGCACAGAP